MRLLLVTLLLGLAAPVSGQVLQEGFDYSTTAVFPPSGWTTTDLGTAPIVWREASVGGNGVQVLDSDAALHRWTSQGIACESRLVSPAMSFVGLSAPMLHFDSELNDVEWMLHFIGTTGSLGNGTSDVDVSADGGVTWSSVWQETSQVDGFTAAVPVSLAPYAGEPAVQIVFRYAGDDGHEWAVDNVLVDNSGAPVGPSLALSGTCPGPATLHGSAMTPGGRVALAVGSQSAPTALAGSTCTGVQVQLPSARRIVLISADAAGDFTISLNLPAAACGSFFGQGLDLASCEATNLLSL